MKKTLFCILTMVVSLLAQSNKDKDHTKYFPISVGNKWEYEWEMGEKEPKPITTTTKEITRLREGESVMETEIAMENLIPVPRMQTYKTINNKLLETGSAGGIFAGKYQRFIARPIVLSFPLDVGKTWQYTEDGGRKFELKVLKWHPEITTKYGKFSDVFEVQEKLTDGTFIIYRFIYYAYGIGMILEEASDKESGVGTRKTMNVLKSYTIK